MASDKPSYSEPLFFGALIKTASFPLWIAGAGNLATGGVRNGLATLGVALILVVCGSIVAKRTNTKKNPSWKKQRESSSPSSA
jgi:hypothetical protein